MSSSLRTGIRTGLNRPGVFGVVAAALTLEFLSRVVVGALWNPLTAVFLPPFFGALVLGGAFPVVCTVATGDDASWITFPTTVGARWPSLLAFAVIGHLVALVAGTGLFLVCDTAIRFVLYAVIGEHLPAGFVVYLPMVGVSSGTLVAWALLPSALAPLLDEEAVRPGLHVALRSIVAAVIESPRRTALLLSSHAVVAVAVAGSAVTGLVYTGGISSFLRLAIVGGGLALLSGTVLFHFVYAIHAASPVTARTVTATVPVRRLAVAALLCLSLVAGAGAVRVTETRPIDTAPDPLPDNPTGAYTVALENTGRANHVSVVTSNVSGEDRFTGRYRAVDRRNRRYLDRTVISAPKLTTRTTLYGSSGVVAYDTRSVDGLPLNALEGDFDVVAAAPGYWTVRQGTDDSGAGGRFALPMPRTGEWTVANRSDSHLTLVLTGDSAYEAVFGYTPASGGVSVEDARLRMVVETERGVVSGGNATIRTDDSTGATANESSNTTTAAANAANRTVTRFRYDVRVDTAVEQPDALGSPTLSEWVWRLFAY
ncbi:hypothetical protein G3I44_07675 [Halogeometricum borinquense]|uniref:Uncharacterized protein n=1 Tax=Halogeometricum borinquense TaxID=60847 RepID=A0A6C0UFM4_9EURY|nr:hypothetical protein [Halogeometricum borinquense]QIB74185.1 hypothetical protein G3I44_07675 [Halogeometricum borinquense]